MRRRSVASVFGIVIAAALSLRAQTTPSSITDQIRIGQIYPSGNVYLKSFATDPGRALPESLLVIPIAGSPDLAKPPSAEAAKVSSAIKPDYIPGIEGMDEEHPSCSPAPRSMLSAPRYLSTDFFEAMLDYCDENEGVALYRAPAVSYSSLVLAVPTQMKPVDVRILSGKRPVTETEEILISQQKQDLDSARDCTTVPSFLDSAQQAAEIVFSGGLSLRLSAYRTPGCAGHLAEIYVLDVLHSGRVLQTVQISQNRGLL